MSVPTPLSSRCLSCKGGSGNPKNLVIFIDGTSNKPGPRETNVKKLYDVICDGPGDAQKKFYLEGIGAEAREHLPRPRRLAKALYGGLEMMFAWNVGENVKKAYKWLVEAYVEGDQIYLFGFSRGAYQVRELASMIHEVGLLKHENSDRIEQAYHRYHSIDPNVLELRDMALKFRKDFCLSGVRIHFIGVWDTVSSLDLIKRDVHITASATVTNACHFRHALALDERRVKFMPEYFLELNAHHNKIRDPRAPEMDVKEVWFAGCHSDVGGTSRPAHIDGVHNPVINEHNNRPHAGIVPLLWMSREASAQGLVFNSEGFSWYPEEVDLGRNDMINLFWKLLEVVPIRHQASFSGTGKHEWRWHMFDPRLVIPGQYIHFSVLPGDAYAPRATLANGVGLPMVSQNAPTDLWATELWNSGLLDDGATLSLLTSLFSDQDKTLEYLGEVLPLLSFRLHNQQSIPDPNWPETSFHDYSGFNKLALTVIYDVICNFRTPELLLQDARQALKNMFPANYEQYPGFFYLVRFSMRHERLRQRFIVDDDVIKALVCALDQTAKSADQNLFPLVVDSLCYLIRDEGKRDYVVGQFTTTLGITAIPHSTTTPDGTEPRSTRLFLALEAKAPSHLVASLNMIATLAECPSFIQAAGLCERLRRRIHELEQRKRGLVGSAAVEALVVLSGTGNAPRDIHISNTIGYLSNTLPRLDVEVGSISPSNVAAAPAPANEEGSTSSSDVIVSLFSVLRTTDPIPGKLDEEDVVMHKLLQTVESRNTRERTAATLTLLKLCRYAIIRNYCVKKKVVDIFMKQSKRKETSLLAAYALHACLNYDMWTPADFPRAAQAILIMVDKGWLDDAVGRVEGSKIFGDLVKSDELRRHAIELDIVAVLENKLESGGPHEVRMSLICLEMLEKKGAVMLAPIVTKCLTHLKDKDKKTQKKGVKVISALAQTAAGEEAIKPHVDEIVRMLLPSDRSSPERSQLYGPSAAVYNLCRNETLRKQILQSKEYTKFRRLRCDETLYPQTDASQSGKAEN